MTQEALKTLRELAIKTIGIPPKIVSHRTKGVTWRKILTALESGDVFYVDSINQYTYLWKLSRRMSKPIKVTKLTCKRPYYFKIEIV